ncbi:MAG: hypothetical protein ACOX9R_15705 [Armatimonadota bacterium]|jgi:hypothetical protein
MPVETRVWEIEGRELRPTESTSLDAEELLQEWIEGDIGIIDTDLLVIGKEVTTDLGDRLDLLAIDPAGQLVVVELKKDQTPRDVVAQVLGYTAWVADLTHDEVEDIARDHLNCDLDVAFNNTFGEELPEVVNGTQRMIVVAAGLDGHVERSIRYLSEKWGVDINAVFFRCFAGENGAQYLVRSWLEEPSEVERRKQKSGGRRSSTIDELREMAAERGAGEEFDLALDLATTCGLSPWRHVWKLNFYGEFPDGRRLKVFGICAGWGTEPGRLLMDMHVDRIARFFEIPEDELESVLPPPHEKHSWARLMSAEDIERFAEAVTGEATEMAE